MRQLIAAAIAFVALVAATPAIAVLPDAPKPVPQRPVKTEAARAPKPVDPMKAILEQFDMSGEWNIEGQRRDRTILRGTLSAIGARGAKSFSGTLVWSSHTTGLSVQQQAQVFVSGDRVRIECSEPTVLRGNGPYPPDTLELSVVESKILRGVGRDARGTHGSVLMVKK